MDFGYAVNKHWLLIAVTCVLLVGCFRPVFAGSFQGQRSLRVVFYNVENLFDCEDDTLKNDEEFLPHGWKGWTPERLWTKLGHLARVIAVSGKNQSCPDQSVFPSLVGLAEVENDACLDLLTKASPLKNAGYRYIHYESPDARGIDVCLLYQPYVFQPLLSRPIRVVFPREPEKTTRDLLYVVGRVMGRDTLHVIVCHLPSQSGGEAETATYRHQAAALLRSVADTLFRRHPQAFLLIMGDFNDAPDSPTLTSPLSTSLPAFELTNLMHAWTTTSNFGTYKYQSTWSIFDQLLVSASLLSHVGPSFRIEAPFLLIPDEQWLGNKPFRTYQGSQYQAGYSDHLPVGVDISF